MAYQLDYFNPRILKEIEAWPESIKTDYARIVELLIDYGHELRMPYSRAMENGLFEIRPKGKDGIGRALYCFQAGRRIIILHAFIKKSQATPQKELLLALKRMKEVING
ncbi:MAG: type II toxin-antitoxin system RelE/ParE family toxin [Chlorobium sp.]